MPHPCSFVLTKIIMSIVGLIKVKDFDVVGIAYLFTLFMNNQFGDILEVDIYAMF